MGAFGVSFGVLARAAHMGIAAPIIMSLTTFAGSAQFAAAAVLADGGGIGAAVVAAILLNARYGPIGLSVSTALRGRLGTRFVQSQLVVDESWAVANQGDGRIDRALLVGAGLALYASWQLGTVIGVFGGDIIGDPETLGLDAAFPALFLALLAPQIRSRRGLTAAVAGGTIALALVPFARPGVPIIAASLGCLAGWRFGGGTSAPTGPDIQASDGLP